MFRLTCYRAALAAVFAAAAPAFAAADAAPADTAPSYANAPGAFPAIDDLARTRPSAHGLFRVSVASRSEPVPLGRMHVWEILVRTARGAPVENARIAISARMPEQPHALPTAPRVTHALGGGRYLAEGVKFDRQGWWHLRLEIGTAAGRDTVAFSVMVGAVAWASWSDEWSESEKLILRSLWIGSADGPPPDPSNAVADSAEAAEFGHRLFFDTRMSANGSVACASCHVPDLAFTDGRRLAEGVGLTTRNAPTIIGAAYSPWLFWDGRKDSLWSQALDPFVSPVEHGTTRARVLQVVRGDADYRRRYVGLFGPLPRAGDAAGTAAAFANLGKAIEAYERALLPAPSRFDRYVAAVLDGRPPGKDARLSPEELAGLRVFISENEGQCIRCHNGPMFTDHGFHNIGSQVAGGGTAERGRADGIAIALADTRNCLGRFSDAPRAACVELRFARRGGADLIGAFKTPTLRFLPRTGPYFHAGQKETLNQAIWHYRDRPTAGIGKSELVELTITDAEFAQLEAFLKTLDGPVRAPERFLRPPD